MLFQLRNLNDSEKETVKMAPVWVAIYVAALDHKIDTTEIKKIKEVIHIKTYSEKNDVHFLYEELDDSAKIDAMISKSLAELPEDNAERLAVLEGKLSRLNSIFSKLNPEYAKNYYRSLRDIAVAIANSAGGVMGVGKITADESHAIKLPMINKP